MLMLKLIIIWGFICLSVISCIFVKATLDETYEDQTHFRVVVQKNLILDNTDLVVLTLACVFSFGISLIFSIIYYHIINKKFKKTGL